MHGIRRTRQSAEALEARKKKETAKLAEYLAVQGDVFARKESEDWSKEALELTTQLLRMNPELYTIWNYRRDIMVKGIFASSTSEQINDILSSELQYTFAALKQYPKVYWIWNHRRWCLENTPDGPDESESGKSGWKRANWGHELQVVEKMLAADARNFHAWDYRRYVIASSPDPRGVESEVNYTLKKIEENFSNFSAWHQRSKLLPSLWESGKKDEKTVKDEEFELIKQAMYVDPNDQSVWLYHRWLIGAGDDPATLHREIQVIQEILDLEPGTKWCLESLVHYKRLLIEHEPQNRNTLSADCTKYLEELIRIDPKRTQRYRELESRIR